jgi:hypothetical protein
LENCSLERAVELADELRATIRDYRFVWKDAAFDIGASIGLVSVSEDSDGIESLLSAADVACYAAKDLGRNRIHVYQHGDAAERHAEMQWVSKVTRALEEERMELYFQPIVPIGNNPDRRGHYELLLRMRDEHGRIVPPSAFIPAAERYNVMPTVDRWVISYALANLAAQASPEDRGQAYTLAINLSGTSLNDDKFLSFVMDAVERHRPLPGTICFERRRIQAENGRQLVRRGLRIEHLGRIAEQRGLGIVGRDQIAVTIDDVGAPGARRHAGARMPGGRGIDRHQSEIAQTQPQDRERDHEQTDDDPQPVPRRSQIVVTAHGATPWPGCRPGCRRTTGGGAA